MKRSKTTIWITGASSGIGASVAEHLANTNVKLILSARNEENLQKVAALCRRAGAEVDVVVVDMANGKDIERAAEQVFSNNHSIDKLIHSAGVSQRAYAMDTDLSISRRFMELNFFGVIDLTQRVLKNMLVNKRGQIVVISSVAGMLGTPMRSSYSASKHALHGYFDSLRAELSASGIDVTIVCPGYIRTEITLNSLKGDGSKYNKIDDAIENGIPVDTCAKRILRGMDKKEEQFIVSGIKEKLGVLIKRLFPALFSKIIREVDPLK